MAALKVSSKELYDALEKERHLFEHLDIKDISNVVDTVLHFLGVEEDN